MLFCCSFLCTNSSELYQPIFSQKKGEGVPSNSFLNVTHSQTLNFPFNFGAIFFFFNSVHQNEVVLTILFDSDLRYACKLAV